MEELLQILSNLRLRCYLMGNYNINLLHNISDNATNDISLFESYSFSQTIIKATRVTDRCATLIDHIWTNDMQNYIKSGILFTSISDHFPGLSCFSLSSQCITSYVTIRRRMYSDDNINTFREDLKKL